jgi:hypothetical protein
LKRLVLLFLFVAFPLCLVGFVFGSVTVSLGQADLRVYIIALNGVNAHGVGNLTETVQGAADASTLRPPYDSVSSYFGSSYFGSDVTVAVKIHVNVTVVSDWDAYKQVVEAGEDLIVVNAHGETLPVPANITYDDWVDTIADAMTNRRVSWVHTAGYPFAYAWYQGANSETSTGEAGFKRLMSHIGLDNVSCSYDDTDELLGLNGYVAQNWALSWQGILDAGEVERGRPLSVSDFKNYTVLPIWYTSLQPDGWMTGAVIEFVKPSARVSGLFGAYVHIGTYATYKNLGDQNVLTDGDYVRGYVGVAVALVYDAWRVASVQAVSSAQASVAAAEREGRTNGLDDAKQLLQRAETCIETRGQSKDQSQISFVSFGYWVAAGLWAADAESAAANATEPGQPAALQLLMVIGLAGTGAAVCLGLIERRRYRRKHERQ